MLRHNRLLIAENQTLKARIKELEAILATSIPTATSIATAQHTRKDPGTAVQADDQKPEESLRFQAGSHRIVKTKRTLGECRLQDRRLKRRSEQ